MTTRDGLFQRPDSKNWWVSYVVGKKTVRESAKTSKKGEAKEFRQRRLSEYYNKGVLGRDLDKVMVRSLWEAAERDFKQDALRSLPDLQTRWHLHLDRFFNCYKAVDVTTDAISKYIEGRQNEDASNATINRELSLLGQIFRKAVASEPPKVMRVPKIKKLDEGAPRMGFLNEIQAEKLLAFAREQAPWFRLFLKMALCYGWRKDSELLSLRVYQVDFLAGKIRLLPGSTKSGKGREVPISTSVQSLLHICCSGKSPDDYVFTYEDGSRVKDFRALWAKATLNAGVAVLVCRACYRAAKLPTKGIDIAIMLNAAQPYSIDLQHRCQHCYQTVLRRNQRLVGLIVHDLRRTFARDARTADISEPDVMSIGGWATPEVFRRYSIVNSRDNRDALRRLEAKREKSRRALHVFFTPTQEKADETGDPQVN